MLEAVPQGPRLLVKPMEASETAHHGIVLPVELARKESRAIVQAVGQGWFRELGEDGPVHTPLGIEPGEVVVYKQGDGTEVSLDLLENGQPERFLVLHMNEVLLTLHETKVKSEA
jgi:co-chaperonin GroES (HSP10)